MDKTLLVVADPDSGLMVWITYCYFVKFMDKTLLAVADPDSGLIVWITYCYL
jgi:hypothetical protein